MSLIVDKMNRKIDLCDSYVSVVTTF